MPSIGRLMAYSVTATVRSEAPEKFDCVVKMAISITYLSLIDQ